MQEPAPIDDEPRTLSDLNRPGIYYESWTDIYHHDSIAVRASAIRLRLRTEALARNDLNPVKRWVLEQPMHMYTE
jgi:hypothetical protein